MLRLLEGAAGSGAENYAAHQARLGRRPIGGPWIAELLRDAMLRGRGGAWFPAYRKVEHIIAQRKLWTKLIVNCCEGEPLSRKDHLLATLRPHLIIDGALILAEAIGSDEVILYLSRNNHEIFDSLKRALKERKERSPIHFSIIRTAHRYVSGESCAVVNRVLGGDAKPTGKRSSGALVHNAETVANVALLARHGAEWFREHGTEDAPGTMLLTITGAVFQPGVYEAPVGITLGEALALAGGRNLPAAAALVGGYAGIWVDIDSSIERAIAPEELAPGCGIIAVLPDLRVLRH